MSCLFPGSTPSPSQLYHTLRNLAGVIGIGAGVYFVSSSLYNVEAGHRAIKYSRIRGIIEKVYGEGTHFAFPWLERPIVMIVELDRGVWHLSLAPKVESSLLLFFRFANG